MQDLSKAFAIVALLSATALAAPAAAAAKAPVAAGPAVPGAADIRCLLTMVALGQQKERQQAAQVGVYFFAGRISARGGAVDLPSAIRVEAAKLDNKTLEAEYRRCGPMIAGQMQTVQASLNALRAANQQAAPPPGIAPAVPQALPVVPAAPGAATPH